jgi:hypothetical protein
MVWNAGRGAGWVSNNGGSCGVPIRFALLSAPLYFQSPFPCRFRLSIHLVWHNKVVCFLFQNGHRGSHLFSSGNSCTGSVSEKLPLMEPT